LKTAALQIDFWRSAKKLICKLNFGDPFQDFGVESVSLGGFRRGSKPVDFGGFGIDAVSIKQLARCVALQRTHAAPSEKLIQTNGSKNDLDSVDSTPNSPQSNDYPLKTGYGGRWQNRENLSVSVGSVSTLSEALPWLLKSAIMPGLNPELDK